jgi:hypothetical protein
MLGSRWTKVFQQRRVPPAAVVSGSSGPITVSTRLSEFRAMLAYPYAEWLYATSDKAHHIYRTRRVPDLVLSFAPGPHHAFSSAYI